MQLELRPLQQLLVHHRQDLQDQLYKREELDQVNPATSPVYDNNIGLTKSIKGHSLRYKL
ncbi:hypothetical protein Hanom_Chr03g00256011 [Helianthus anomalus]